MKFVQNNKILVDSNAEIAEEAQRRPSWLLLLCAWLCDEIVFLFGSGFAGLGRGCRSWAGRHVAQPVAAARIGAGACW